MRYAQGGGLTAEGRRRREQVRLEAARRFEQRVPSAGIAAELRVSERSVRRWRQAWQVGGPAGLASRGQAAQCRLDEQQLAALDLALEAGPLAAGWEDQRWTLARVRDLVAAQFKAQYTVPGIWYLLRRRGWTCQIGARRAIERDDGAVEVWKKETWPRDASPAGPPASQACRHRRTDRSLTRSSAAITAAGTRCPNLLAASSRTCSRRLRPSAVSPPPCAYRIYPAYRHKPTALKFSGLCPSLN
jgi:transposase